MKKVIILEELLEALEREQSFLNRTEIEVLPASSNRIALYMHEAQNADLIITNIDSDAMSAEELCTTIRKDPELRKVSIIVVSLGRESDMERMEKCRANAFLTAPINPVMLLGNVRKLLDVPTRLDYRAPVSVKIEGESGDEPFLGYSENISASGMLISTDKPLKKGEIIQCSFFLPTSARIHSEAVVVRALEKPTEYDPFRYGVHFSLLDEKLRMAIDDFVRDYLRKE